MNLIISSYVCDPYKSSEDGMGWNYAYAASKTHQVYVLTGTQNKSAITRYMEENKMDLPSLHFEFIDPLVHRQAALDGEITGRLMYILWQYAAVKRANEIIRQSSIDYVHHITWATCVLPIQMHRVKAPLIYGPVGAGERVPRCIKPPMSMKDRLAEAIRVGLLHISRIFPSNVRTADKAHIILVTTEETKQAIYAKHRQKTVVMQAIGVRENQLRVDRLVKPGHEGTFHIMMAGRLVYWKGTDLGIEAVKKLLDAGADVDLTVVGDGKRMAFLRWISRGYEDKIKLLGKLPYQEMMSIYDRADLLVNCSYHDSGCIVVLEAMSRGLPVVCLDVGGPGVLTTSESAIKIRPAPYGQLVDLFAEGIKTVLSDDEKRKAMIVQGYRRVEKNFLYANKYDQIMQHMQGLAGIKNEEKIAISQ